MNRKELDDGDACLESLDDFRHIDSHYTPSDAKKARQMASYLISTLKPSLGSPETGKPILNLRLAAEFDAAFAQLLLQSLNDAAVHLADATFA